MCGAAASETECRAATAVRPNGRAVRSRRTLRPGGRGVEEPECFTGLIDQLAESGMDRRSLLVNFGGGVISDLGGFVASSYMRGIGYANLSTTLVGQLDASVGGKGDLDVFGESDAERISRCSRPSI
ncbi:MAG: hypothetical protein KDC87_11395 [Planctomycetes bacterium]|nr:hypothetical protein [Planctomycetota bacterium]